MKKKTDKVLPRREFMRRAGHLGVAGMAMPWAMNFAAMGEAAAADATDYKAMVCIFLSGGNDYANTFVPFDPINYAKYAAIRTGIATPHASLADTVLTPVNPLPGGMQLALAPQMTRLKSLFDSGKLAVQLNVGTLIKPVTRTQFYDKSVALPPRVGSHNDQASLWQSSLPEGATSGWGGRMGDLLESYSNSQSPFTCISLAGNSLFLSGQQRPCMVTSDGAVAIGALQKRAILHVRSSAAALEALIKQPSANILQNDYVEITKASISLEGQLNNALDQANLSTPFADNPLAQQLKSIAKLISARQSLGVKRQVFMVSLRGFDHHDDLVARHPGLLATVSDAMASFYDATLELGVAKNVTTFTASDFGRNYISNGDGSDHGWGSHHFVMGGSVKGQRFYGKAPQIDMQSDEYVNRGTLIPTTSVDQYTATMAKWFGVMDKDMHIIAPNLGNFAVKNMGFV